MILVGQEDERGWTLLFDKWANETNCRVRVWRLVNGDVRIEFVDPELKHAAGLTLTSYRADDLAVALTRGR